MTADRPPRAAFAPGQISPELAEAALSCPEVTSGNLQLPREQEPEAVLTVWLHAVYRRLGFPSYTPWNTAFCVLLQLGIASDAMTVAELAGFIRDYAERISGEGEGVKCLDCGQVHDLSPVGDFTAPHGNPERSRSPVGMLADFGAVAWADAGPHGMLWLTPLGRMLAISLFFGASPVPDASVEEVIELIGALPGPVQRIMIQYWLTGRSAADAVRELLTYAAPRAGTPHSGSARLLATMTGTDGMDGWREWAAKPGYGVYARQWLEGQGEPLPDGLPEEQELTDKLWLGIDEILLPAQLRPDLIVHWFREVRAHSGDAGVDAVLWSWRQTGHPAVPRLAELIGEPAKKDQERPADDPPPVG
jgi:hypothetical protein